MTEPPPIAIRDYCKDDLPFVANSWRLSLRKCHPFSAIEPGWYHSALGLLIGELMTSATVHCRVATLPDDDTLMLGYVVGNKASRVLHYLFVKRDFRPGDVGSRLVADMFGGRQHGPINVTSIVNLWDDRGGLIRDTFPPVVQQATEGIPTRVAGRALLDEICPDRPRPHKAKRAEKPCN